METGQIVFYGILALFMLFFLRRFFIIRSITQYSPSEASERIKSNGAVLLDVRTQAERQSQSIKGSVHIPLTELRAREKELEKFKNREIICYCATGSRSVSAAARLKKSGYATANLKGGMSEWMFSGLK